MKNLFRIVSVIMVAILSLTAAAAFAGESVQLPDLEYESSMDLKYATQFSVDYYKGGYKLISIADGYRYLVVPEGGDIPEGLDPSIKVLQQPICNIYLQATSAMALFDALDALDSIRLAGTQADGWYVENAVTAMNEGRILFAGKYSEPDYETMIQEDCHLAIESTMILHSPKVMEMIELLGIPVFIERSSYEDHPMARVEWIKLYGTMLNMETEAEAFFNEKAKSVEALSENESTGKKVAFFYVSSDGSVVVYCPGRYVPRMIELAGGIYVPSDTAESDSDRSTVSLTMEEFYASAIDADILIYNASIDNPLDSIRGLLEKSNLFADFKAVKEGNVWCTGKYLFQATDIISEVIEDMHSIIEGTDTETSFIYKLS